MEMQIKNNLSIIEYKKLGIYLLRIIIIYGLIQAITAVLGMDLTNYIPQIYIPLVLPFLNWCLEILNQYKKGIELPKEIEEVESVEKTVD